MQEDSYIYNRHWDATVGVCYHFIQVRDDCRDAAAGKQDRNRERVVFSLLAMEAGLQPHSRD